MRARDHCEYCKIAEADSGFAHQVDHIVSKKHGGGADFENLALACAIWNRHKGSDVASFDPDSGELIALFHPRRNEWTDHFEIKEGRIEPKTAIGRVTAKILRFNVPERIEERVLLQRLQRYPGP